MYLKSLNVVGFKSFADRTTLDFHRGVTAIVGPNGCGKSNVLDSIRWVLGEQSAKALRGGEMKDVIFSGTETRPPLGMAEVSLTFGDCEEQLGTEFNEVTITRRVFRDGVSEYEINKTACRLRDIHSLFMDTGIGRSAYSIMEQGKIDMILSSRPEDRRTIFEEAAGITKYKSQKKEALRKLENTEANLIRLADIIREVRRQIGSLQRQAGKARRYQESFEELARMENRLGRHQLDEFSAGIAALEGEVAIARTRQEELQAGMSSQEEKVTMARTELAEVEATLLTLREEQATLRNAWERAAQQVLTNQARVEEFGALRDQARQEIAATEEKVRIGEEQLATLNAQLDDFSRRRGETQERFDAEQEALQILTARIGALEAERAEIDEQRVEQDRLFLRHEQELAGLELQQRNFQLRVEALRTEQEALAQRHTQAEGEVTLFVTKLESSGRSLEENRTALQAAQEARRAAEEALRAAEATRVEVARAHDGLEARRQVLRQLDEQHASAPQAAQRLLRETGAEAHLLRGTLAGHLSVQAGYEAPLALLLGDAVNALVLEDDAAARSWRERLTGNEQCAFAPLRTARPTPLPSTAPSHASHFVTAQPLARELVAALLEDAHVVDDLAAGWRLKAAQPQSTVATRAGELITRSGLLLVGQDAGASLAVLTRQSELRQLETEVAACAEKLTVALAAVAAARSTLEEQTEQVEKTRAAVHEAEMALAAQRQEERAARTAAAEIARLVDDAAREITRLTSQEQVDHEHHENLRQAMAAADRARTEATARVTSLKVQIEEQVSREAAQGAALTELRIELATQVQQCEAWQRQREPVATRLQELRDLGQLRTRESVEHEQRVVQAREAIVLAEQERIEKSEAQTRMGSRIEETMQQRAGVQERIDAEEITLRGLRREHGELQSTRAAREVKLAEQRLFLNNLRERFRRDYQKELEELPALVDEETPTDWAALEAEAASRRAALDALGPVNLEAITEHDELEQRHQFLATQETDLLTAKEQILQAIAEINRTTQKLFIETFEQVKINFQEMFTDLFGGGKATLSLMDEGDPLECGIEIVARPPGKQNQSVSLLSGGERTMTAVALLFAIYLVKPSPFCVLDEMDAPLDESNINRFIKILQRFVKQSQFVVITHNKRTISISDVLYGVTMEDRGVSKFVSMRLRQGESSTAPEKVSEEAVPSIAESVTG